MKDIKNRIKSVESTMQITKAMELVASSKLRKARERADRSRPYFNIIHAALNDIAMSNTDFTSPYVQKRPVNKTCYVMVAGDRGLAGGYNNNLFKTVAAHMGDKSVCVLPIGKKAVEYCERRQMEILTKEYAVAEDVTISDCYGIAQLLGKAFLEGEFDELYVGYTNFVSMLSQSPAVIRTLPLNDPHRSEQDNAPGKAKELIIYEPSTEAVFDAIVPEYISGIVYGAISESWASEIAARRTAMDAASKNAGEMIETLNLHYNRARQGAITQEISEIVAGAEQ